MAQETARLAAHRSKHARRERGHCARLGARQNAAGLFFRSRYQGGLQMKVRIAVVINPKGEWFSSGWGRGQGKEPVTDKEKMDCAVEMLDECETRYFIEVEIPVPETKTIQAEIVK
jgi:hypothetical protein